MPQVYGKDKQIIELNSRVINIEKEQKDIDEKISKLNISEITDKFEIEIKSIVESKIKDSTSFSELKESILKIQVELDLFFQNQVKTYIDKCIKTENLSQKELLNKISYLDTCFQTLNENFEKANLEISHFNKNVSNRISKIEHNKRDTAPSFTEKQLDDIKNEMNKLITGIQDRLVLVENSQVDFNTFRESMSDIPVFNKMEFDNYILNIENRLSLIERTQLDNNKLENILQRLISIEEQMSSNKEQITNLEQRFENVDKDRPASSRKRNKKQLEVL